MKHIQQVKIIGILLFALLINRPYIYAQTGSANISIVLNPYKDVNWSTFSQNKAALHVHTLQSDGYHMVNEVVRNYQQAGFKILAITDHDKMEPNSQFERGRIDWATFDKVGTPFPKDPKPKNYPFNTTWPWTDYGGPDPKEVEMVGIEAAEISFLHHMNSFFSPYGTGYTAANEDEQLSEMSKAGGVVFFNHPSSPAPFSGGGRKSIEWYTERFKKFGPDFLLGIDISGGGEFTEGLWDQLLARFMPLRPIWGFCTEDMHRLANSNQAPHSIFVLDKLSSDDVKKAMIAGQFYSTRSTQRKPGLYPTVKSIKVNFEAGTITIVANNCDTIRWISAPKSLETVGDINKSDHPFPLGQIVYEGATLNYKTTPNIKNYVRAELLHSEGGQTYRTFINPFGISSSVNR
jgi:hypothetical protein